MKLYVLSDYRNRKLSYQAGTEIEVEPELATYLIADSPFTFERIEGEGRGLEGPPQDKMISSPAFSKMSVPELKSVLKAKGLPVGGKKSDLVERLENV